MQVCCIIKCSLHKLLISPCLKKREKKGNGQKKQFLRIAEKTIIKTLLADVRMYRSPVDWHNKTVAFSWLASSTLFYSESDQEEGFGLTN